MLVCSLFKAFVTETYAQSLGKQETMSRPARRDVFLPSEINKLQITSRCVRECQLMGINPKTGRDYQQRRAWLEKRIKRLAAYFAIEIQSYSISDRELVLTILNRPDNVEAWSDREVTYRWLMICPKRKTRSGEPREPNEEEILEIVQDKDLLRELRTRLSDPSWLMRLILQPLAARANLEEDLTGDFWQGRYQALVLLDEATTLAASVFTDLASIKDDLQKQLCDSLYSSLRIRWESLHSRDTASRLDSTICSMKHAGTLESGSPILRITLEEYIDLLDWTRKGLILNNRNDLKEPKIVPHRIIEKHNISVELWFLMATEFDRMFYLFSGMHEVLLNYRRNDLNYRCHVRVAYRDLYMLAA